MLSSVISININPFSAYSTESDKSIADYFDSKGANSFDQYVRLIKQFDRLNKRVKILPLNEYTTSRVDDSSIWYSWMRIFYGTKGEDCLKTQISESSVIMDNSLEFNKNATLYVTDKIVRDNNMYRLKSSISFYIMHHNNYYVINFEPLGIEVVEKTIEDALDSFNEEFAMVWRVYGLEDDTKLSADAQKLKQTIQTIVKDEVQII